MNDKYIDELIDRVLQEEKELPEGLSARLESYVDELAAADKQKQIRRVKRRTLYGLSGVAAALLFGVALFFQTEQKERRLTAADTFNDPTEAAVVAQEALAFLSSQFNKGIEQLSEAQGEVNKINEIVNKQLDLNTQ